MKIHFESAPRIPDNDRSAVAMFVFADRTLSADTKMADAQLDGLLSRAAASSRFTGKAGQVLHVPGLAGSHWVQWILIGAGEESKLGSVEIEHAAAHAYRAAESAAAETLELRLSTFSSAHAARAAFGVQLAAYRFDRHKTKVDTEKQPSVTEVQIQVSDASQARAAFAESTALIDGVFLARDLTSEPPNVLFPREFAQRVLALGRNGLTIETLGEGKLRSLGMGALLGVGQGSARESQLVVMHWQGAGADSAPVAFVGKGVCFDSGGISIKAAENMDQMKWDMGGAAAVAGLLYTLALRKAPVNAVGILGLVENMPDGNAQRPGDIVKSMSGQTIEILNTDAEGRLVLADALWYCQQRFNPRAIIDVATLTGAAEVALGKLYAAVFCNQDELANALLTASAREDEPLWRMPLVGDYDEQLDSGVADLRNIGAGRPAGAITAALFLQHFIQDRPWAHLDIAGVAWKKPSRNPTIPEGATGFGVRLLDRLVREHYEVRTA
jgi:leucyl aminopeptidase